MQDLLFNSFLYTTMICFICYLRYQPKKTAIQTSQTAPQEDKWEAMESDETQEVDAAIMPPLESPDFPALATKEAKSIGEDPEPETKNEDGDFLGKLVQSEPTPKTNPQAVPPAHTTATEQLDGINISKLPLRVCRKIASELTTLSEALAISQKVNKKDKPVSQLRAEIKNRLSKDPATVAPVIAQHAASTPKMPPQKNRLSASHN